MRRSALITGSEGFVGKHLRAHLSANGWEVRGCDIAVPSGVEDRFRCDLTGPEETEGLMRWADGVTHVFHLAAITYLPDAAKAPTQTFRTNLEGTINLATALHEHHGDARLIFISSSEVYGPPQVSPVTEEHPLNPGNPYAISKAAAEQYCAYLSAATGQDIIRLRPFNHTGPGQSHHFALPSFARQIAEIEAGKREPVLRVGNLSAARDLSHVTDVVRAYELAALQGVTGEAYNICSGESHPMQDALDRLRDLSTVTGIRTEEDPALFRASDIPEIRGSHQKLTAATAWRPQILLPQLLTDLLTHWRHRIQEEA